MELVSATQRFSGGWPRKRTLAKTSTIGPNSPPIERAAIRLNMYNIRLKLAAWKDIFSGFWGVICGSGIHKVRECAVLSNSTKTFQRSTF